MQFKRQGFIPNDPTGFEYNPNGTMPFPRPPNRPVGLWDGGTAQVALNTDADPTIWRTGIWQSPTFDLRPDLRSSTGGEQVGVPIWGSGSLFVMVNGLLSATAAATNGLVVTYTEIASPNKGFQLKQVSEPINITDEFTTNGNKESCILQFYSVNFSQPVRFWRIQLQFTWTLDISALGLPTFSVDSAYY
jgi:hypothetical protein